MLKKIWLTVCLLVFANAANAFIVATQRLPQFSNNDVSVWETTIFPSAHQVLKMHRHEHDRVIVPFTDGLLKITNNQGQSHFLHLVKNKALFLSKDVPNETHQDENLSRHAIKVLVIELNKS